MPRPELCPLKKVVGFDQTIESSSTATISAITRAWTGWFYLSTVLDDFSRYILAWKLCTTMSAADVSDTLQPGAEGLWLGPGQRSTSAAAAER